MSEKFRGITFAEQAVTPADDAIVRRAILPDGFLTGCEISYSGSTLTMAAGYIIACGRSFQHIAAENWAVVDQTSGFARLVLTIDLSQTSTEETFNQITTSIEYASAVDGFVQLEQSDINLSGTRYQIAACVVSLGTGGITGIVSQLPLSRAEGGGLNFSVVDGLTQPSDPKENMIWVYTEGMTGWYFQPAQPETMKDGEVWISTGISSPVAFNALKKNSIQVHPISAKQMVSGSLVSKTCQIYQNGEWKPFVMYLYKDGEEYKNLTGGWTESFKRAGSITATPDGFVLSYSDDGGSGICYSTEEPIDLSAVSTIEAVLADFSATNNGYFGIGVYTERMTNYDSFNRGVAFSDLYSGDMVSVNVSALNGEFYIYFGVKAGYEENKISKVSGTLKEIKAV